MYTLPCFFVCFCLLIPPFFCYHVAEARQARSARALKVGTLRPAIVLYDEPHPLGDDIGTIQTADLTRKPDMLIIMGTSLKVHGFKKLVKEFAKVVHESPSAAASPSEPSSSLNSPSKTPNKKTAKNWAGKVVFVNKTAPGCEWDGIIDYHIQGESDVWVEKVLEDWKKTRPSDWEVQKTLDAVVGAADGTRAGGSLKVMKELTNAADIKAKGSRKKTTCTGAAAENTPAADALTLAFGGPLSPQPLQSKRRSGECHYSGGEGGSSSNGGNPAKKKRPLARTEFNLDFDGGGLLFGDSTNLRAGDGRDGQEDVFSNASHKDVLEPERPRGQTVGPQTIKIRRSRRNLKVEVVVAQGKGKGAVKNAVRPPSRATVVR
jgi:NAD+-dependent protein deacetylase SIR2